MSEKTKQEKIEILEMDELYTYVKKKSEKHEFGLLLIGKRCALLHLKWSLGKASVLRKLI